MIVKLAAFDKEAGVASDAIKGKITSILKKYKAGETLDKGEKAILSALHGSHGVRNAGRKASEAGSKALAHLNKGIEGAKQTAKEHGSKAVEYLKNNKGVAYGGAGALVAGGGILAAKKMNKEK